MPLTQKNIIADIMKGASESESYNRSGVIRNLKFNRIFHIDGMNQYSTPRTALSDAKALIKAIYPIGDPCPTNELATAREYSASSAGSDDVVEVTVGYIYDDPSIAATQWTIECSDFLEIVDSDTELSKDDGDDTVINGVVVTQGNRRPINVKYYADWQYGDETKPFPVSTLNPTTGTSYTTGLPLQSFAHVGVLRPRKRLVFTRTIYGNADAQKIEAAADDYEGALNSTTFRNRAPGVWMCMSVGVIYQPYAGSNLARLEFVGRPLSEGWQPWVRYSNPLFGGTPPNVFRYTPGGKVGNGIRRSYQYLAADFNTLLALLPGGTQGEPTSGSSPVIPNPIITQPI